MKEGFLYLCIKATNIDGYSKDKPEKSFLEGLKEKI
jgi:hypothetical protein